MNSVIKKNYLYTLFCAVVITSLILLLSFQNEIWIDIWSYLKIPPNYIPFSDFKAHVYFLECYRGGIDIFEENCNLIPEGNAKLNTHPKIWILIFDKLNLQNILNFNIAVFFFLFLYLFILFSFLKKFDLKHKIFIIFLYLSTTNFLLIERFATDLIIFILVYFTVNLNSRLLQSLFIYFGFLLKYYPLFLISIFTNNKKFLMSYVVIILIIIFFYLNDLYGKSLSIVEMALPIAYGSRTILSAFYHLSTEYNLFINDENLNFYRKIFISLFFIYCLVLVLLGYSKSSLLNLNYKFDKFFMAGSGIYLGTFIFGSNADYRLIFLLLTLPLIFSLKNKLIKFSLLISYFFVFNSFYFLIGEKISLTFFVSSFINFFLKILIFSLISLIFGSQLKQVNFLKF